MPATRLMRLVYVSALADGVSDLDIETIVSIAQVRNRRLDVTGLLVRGPRHFAQVLEGRPEALEDVMVRIRADRRHVGVRLLAREPITTRRFGDWALALVQRHDVADELAELHATGRLGELDLRSIVDRLALARVAA